MYDNEIFRVKVSFSGAQIIVVVTVAQDRLMSSKMPCCLNYCLDLRQWCSKTLVQIAAFRCTRKRNV